MQPNVFSHLQDEYCRLTCFSIARIFVNYFAYTLPESHLPTG